MRVLATLVAFAHVWCNAAASSCFSVSEGSFGGSLSRPYSIDITSGATEITCVLSCTSANSVYGTLSANGLTNSNSDCGASININNVGSDTNAQLFLYADTYQDLSVDCACVDTSTPAPTPTLGCFSGETLVQRSDHPEPIQMKHLKVGDAVLAKSGVYKRVYAWGHIDRKLPASFLQLHMADAPTPLEVTGDHMVYVNGKAGPIRAEVVNIGDELLGSTPGKFHEVTKITSKERSGVFYPLTEDGTIVVNGVLASTYVDIQRDGNEYMRLGRFQLPFTKGFLSHVFYSPLRLWCLGVAAGICEGRDHIDGANFWDSLGSNLDELAENQESLHGQLVVYLLTIVVPAMSMTIEFAVGPSLAPLLILLGCVAVLSWGNTGAAGRAGKRKVA
ncbi:Desert hedgehog protein [Seminavis robusta]|uniref:Desert hedgehog protein n=1 Tax=Seminavis robusta TaxID=568900 RepID=A0A9N8H4D2_9STRA|nr:Desert hedgehog protein [Seminavis robusta]|eukprot:Sro7_g005740.1 Desert hedgehog protein (390) ;mRNA; f:15728-16897